MTDYQEIVNGAFDRGVITPDVTRTVQEVMALLDSGTVRIAEKKGDAWQINAWVQKAILLYFKIQEKGTIVHGPFEYADKIPLKKGFAASGVRVVPPATVRYGAYVDRGAILMPSYVNIGAYVGANTMVDTWATVGSGAQVGKNVHIAGGVGLGGVLEPPGSQPVIIEDDVFIGSRCIIVEGTIIERGAVLAANVSITGSTRIIDVSGSTPIEHKGRVPANSVVVPGSTEKRFSSGTYHVQCALIIGKRKASTDAKVALNMILR